MSHRSSALILAMLLSGALTLSACYEDTEATGPAPVESTAASGGSSTAPDEGSTGSGQADPSKGATSASPARISRTRTAPTTRTGRSAVRARKPLRAPRSLRRGARGIP